jgi:hypothetical protein
LFRRRRSLWIALAPANRSITMVPLSSVSTLLSGASRRSRSVCPYGFARQHTPCLLHSRCRSSSFSSRCAAPRVLVCVFDSISFRDPALSTASSSLLPPPPPPPRIFRLRAIKSSKTESKEGRQQANGYQTSALCAWAVISAGLVPRRHHSLLRLQQ